MPTQICVLFRRILSLQPSAATQHGKGQYWMPGIPLLPQGFAMLSSLPHVKGQCSASRSRNAHTVCRAIKQSTMVRRTVNRPFALSAFIHKEICKSTNPTKRLSCGSCLLEVPNLRAAPVSVNVEVDGLLMLCTQPSSAFSCVFLRLCQIEQLSSCLRL